MNDARTIIGILAALFILMACCILAASFISTRVPERWSMAGFAISALTALIFAAATKMRGDADHKAVMDGIRADGEARMKKIQSGTL